MKSIWGSSNRICTYRFTKLAESLSYSTKQQLETFLCWMPMSMFIYAANASSMHDTLGKLKKGMAFGTYTVPIPEPKTAVLFIMTRNKTVNFGQETIIVDRLENVKDEKMLCILERVSVAIEQFGNDRNRKSDRSKHRYRDERLCDR